MNFIVMMLFTIIFLLPTKSFAGSGYYEDCFYETGDRISLSVFGEVTKNADTGIFSYSYTIQSNPQSEQDVWVFEVTLPEKGIITSAAAPTGWGGPGWSGKTTRYSQFREIKPPYQISWTAPDERDFRPSETANGFMFQTSFGLPGIVDYYTEGVALVECDEGMAVDFIPGYDDLTPYGPGIVGKTVGPAALPTDFNLVEFLNSIIDLKHQSTSLGWIKDVNAEQSLDMDLENAKREIELGNNQTAKDILSAFLSKVEAQGCSSYTGCSAGKPLTPEAYALLKYNVQYLMEHIIVAACPENGSVVSYDSNGVKHTYTSIQSAINESGVGWRITVGAGTYNEVVSIAGKTNLTLKGCNKPVVNGGFKLSQASNIIVDGFDIIARSGDNAITMLGGNNSSENVTISNNSIHGADIEHSGISAARNNPELYILDNHIYENGRNGVVFVDATGGMHYLRRNVIENNGWNGVWVARDHNILLEGNTISHNGTRTGTTGGRYGVIRERMTGTGNPQGITLINNTITCNNGEEIAGKSSKDLGNYDQMIDATDTGNVTGCQP